VVSGVVIRVREISKANASLPMTLWALSMDVVLWLSIVSPSAGVTVAGFALTALLGVYLGWRHRLGAVFAAPLVSWLFAWFPMEIASMVHFGVLKGFFVGLVIITIGWFAIGFVEFVWLGMVAALVRQLRGRNRDDTVVLFGPDDERSRR
jgi:hypothetical protein